MENKNIIAALVKAQLKIGSIPKNGTNPMYKSKYATLDDILNAVRLTLADEGCIISYSIERNEQGHFAVVRLMHISGEVLESKFPMVLEKQTNQGVASARTYACRYALCNLLALPSGEDDDGNAAEVQTQKKRPSLFKDSVKKEGGEEFSDEATYLNCEQVAALEKLVGADTELADRILQGWSTRYQEPVQTFYDIKVDDFGKTLHRLQLMKNPKPIARQA